MRPFRIRRCLPADIESAYRVCLATGDSGNDGTSLYPDDPSALGNVYVGPYVFLEPELAFVLEDQLGVCGYVLAALDSARFYERYVREWLPPLQSRIADPAGDPADWTPTQRLYHEVHHPRIHFPEVLQAYPSHAHIDLLPRAQGQGNGRRMMEHELATLTARGSTAVHLGLSAANHRAHGFYLRLGFVDIERTGRGDSGVIYMGRRLP